MTETDDWSQTTTSQKILITSSARPLLTCGFMAVGKSEFISGIESSGVDYRLIQSKPISQYKYNNI